MGLKMLPDDDSCPKCGHESGDGLPHYRCPVECSVCSYLGDPDQRCPQCSVWDVFTDMSPEEKVCMKELLG